MARSDRLIGNLGDPKATVEDGIGRKINRERTRIIPLGEPGASRNFRGDSFRYEPDRYGRAERFLNRVPSAKVCAREQEKLRGMISDWAWCNSKAGLPSDSFGGEGNRKAQCGKTACCV